jgi:outer membrane protein
MFDFGASDAGVRSARLALTAAIADQNSAQLAQYEDALRLYVAALVSQARLQSLETAEKAARTSTDIARARHAAQAGTLAEKLQAESALALVTSDATRARGQARSAQGRLAIALGFRATQAVNLIPIELVRANARFTGLIQDREPPSMSELWIVLQDQHPRLAAIRAEIASLEARLDQSKAESSGSVTLNSGLALNRGLGGTSGRENSPSSNLSIQYTVPLFEGASRDARLAQISAQVVRRQAQLAQLEQELESELWQALQQLSAERDNLKATDALLATSKQAEEVALGRFKAGVGSLSDLLNAQSVHSQAIFQRANASIEELQAQIRLVFSTGKTKPP